MGLKIMPKWIETFMNMKKDILALTSTEFQEDLFFSWNVQCRNSTKVRTEGFVNLDL